MEYMNDTFLAGRNALVTGGTRGIGLAIAEALSSAGAGVVLCGRNQGAVDSAVRQLTKQAKSKVAGKVADVRSSTEVAELFSFADRELGSPDILVNNAGVGIFQSTGKLSVDDWQTTLDTNLSGVFYCCREMLARVMKRAGAYIINIGSLAGKNAFAGGAAYNASKFGLKGFSEAMMLDHRYDNVRVTHIMPGSVDTQFSPSSERADWKIAPQDIGQIVLMLLRMPDRTLVSQVEVRPSRPRK
ncbi:MAG TPA: SDR family oxidoreductase [Bryobacteraceae bacterium]|nr:SDR family oxidoreductase [Bryobacteraceae bacterium]